jgi:hypothetical protein
MPVTEEASSVIACEAAVSFRAESAILSLQHEKVTLTAT